MELYLIKNPIDEDFWPEGIYRSLAKLSPNYPECVYVFDNDGDPARGDYFNTRGSQLRCRQDSSST